MSTTIKWWTAEQSISGAILEHRLSPRIACHLPVFIRARNSWSMECTITNINRTGLCLDTGPIRMTQGSIVEILIDSDGSEEAIDSDEAGSPGTETLVAMVIHSSKGRAGLWLGDDPEQYKKLQAFYRR
ncbi:MAG: PilZ domain-containing protein [Gammaproteobacteria bacterium]